MEEKELLHQIFDTISEVSGLHTSQFSELSTLDNDLGLGTLEKAELVISLEEDFEISYPEDDWENVNTVGDIVKYIKEKKETQA